METRVAVIGIIVEKAESVESLNAILHEYGNYIIGRMGVPYRTKGINVISVAIDAPGDIISALAGKVGNLPGVATSPASAPKPLTPTSSLRSKRKEQSGQGGKNLARFALTTERPHDQRLGHSQ